jgi:hypothetical protein
MYERVSVIVVVSRHSSLLRNEKVVTAGVFLEDDRVFASNQKHAAVEIVNRAHRFFNLKRCFSSVLLNNPRQRKFLVLCFVFFERKRCFVSLCSHLDVRECDAQTRDSNVRRQKAAQRRVVDEREFTQHVCGETHSLLLSRRAEVKCRALFQLRVEEANTGHLSKTPFKHLFLKEKKTLENLKKKK